MSEEERLKLEDVITTDTGKALIKEIKYNELMQQRVEILLKQNRELHSIIKEVREYIEDKYAVILADDLFLDHDERIERKRIQHILEILDKVGEE